MLTQVNQQVDRKVDEKEDSMLQVASLVQYNYKDRACAPETLIISSKFNLENNHLEIAHYLFDFLLKKSSALDHNFSLENQLFSLDSIENPYLIILSATDSITYFQALQKEKNNKETTQKRAIEIEDQLNNILAMTEKAIKNIESEQLKQNLTCFYFRATAIHLH